jgi:hypothetical protein
MNKVILKEQKKKEEEKPKKKKPELRITKELIKARLINHFKNHIGEAQQSNKEEIFEAAIGINSFAVNSFARFYFWEAIEKMIRRLRSTDECFVIKKKGNYFVLKEQDEADYYKGVCDKSIENMQKAQDRADNWVANEKWKDLGKKKYFDPHPITPKTPEEKIDDRVNKAEHKSRI